MSVDRNTLDQTAEQTALAMAHVTQRIRTELEFAEGLCERHPVQAAGWKKLIAEAVAEVQPALAGGSLATVRQAVTNAENLLAPIGRAGKRYTIFLVGHAHIDMNWMWSWPETCAVVNDTFTTVLRLMDEFPTFKLSQSQASVYALVEEHNPVLFKRIGERVAEGRWEVTASHWVEGDKNLAGAEALCRHLLYTRRYMQQHFSLKPEDVLIDWSPDTFGHAATIPSLLARGGVTRYYGHRFGNTVTDRPLVFWWEGPDGSRVLVRNDSANGYNGVINETLGRRALEFERDTGLHGWMFVFGVGDHGGGPTRRDILRALDMTDWPIFPTIEFSRTSDFYEFVEREGKNLPVHKGELNYEFTGCYTTQTLIKKCNRYGENQLADSEAAATLAWALTGAKYPAAKFIQGWKDTLFSHFHDILPGSGVHDTRTYCHGMFQRTAAVTSMIETQALRGLAARVDTARGVAVVADATPPPFIKNGLGAGVGFGTGTGGFSAAEQSAGAGARPFLIFNPTGHEREEVVTVTIWDNDPGAAPSWGAIPTVNRLQQMAFSVLAPSGKKLAPQLIEVGSYWGHQFAKLAFPTERIPAHGWGVYTVIEGATTGGRPGVWHTGPNNVCGYASLEHLPIGMENEHTSMALDPRTGGIRSLKDRRSGLELIAPGRSAAVLEYGVERPHNMSAWSMSEMGPLEGFEVAAIERKARGPHLASIEVKLRRGENSFTLSYELRAGDPQLYLSLSGTWIERGDAIKGIPALRMAFPLALTKATARYEIPFGAVDRALHDGEEVPALQWAQVRGKLGKGEGGFLLVNDSKHGHSLEGATLRLTLIRSSHDPDPIPEVGQHSVRLAISPLAGDLPVADAIRRGNNLNHALRLVGTDVHAGELPQVGTPLICNTPNVICTCLKKAEDEDALVVRLFETLGKRTTAVIVVDEGLVGKVRAVREIDLMERPLAKNSAKAGKGRVSVTIPAYGVVTLKIDGTFSKS